MKNLKISTEIAELTEIANQLQMIASKSDDADGLTSAADRIRKSTERLGGIQAAAVRTITNEYGEAPFVEVVGYSMDNDEMNRKVFSASNYNDDDMDEFFGEYQDVTDSYVVTIMDPTSFISDAVTLEFCIDDLCRFGDVKDFTSKVVEKMWEGESLPSIMKYMSDDVKKFAEPNDNSTTNTRD